MIGGYSLSSFQYFEMGDLKASYSYHMFLSISHSVFSYSRIIWLGDLNYRIALSYRSAKALVEMRNWRALLENDQACFLSCK